MEAALPKVQVVEPYDYLDFSLLQAGDKFTLAQIQYEVIKVTPKTVFLRVEGRVLRMSPYHKAWASFCRDADAGLVALAHGVPGAEALLKCAVRS